jgi:DNA-binding MarR family transcriptional regulator
VDPQNAPERLRQLPSWLLGQVATASSRLVAETLHAAHSSHRNHYALLATLAEAGAISQAELGRRIGLDRSDVTALVNLLEGHGFIERVPDPADRRRNLVSLTSAGTDHLVAMDAVVGGAQAELLAPLDEADRVTLVRLLRRILAHHRDGDGDGGSG